VNGIDTPEIKGKCEKEVGKWGGFRRALVGKIYGYSGILSY
jgi:hypothetical protein